MYGVLGGVSASAGLVTSVMAEAMEPGGVLQICDTGTTNQGSAACSTPGRGAGASATAAASYGVVSAYIDGSAYSYGGYSQATAYASFSDRLTFYGGTGVGSLTIFESVLRYGTGSLQFGAASSRAEAVQVTQSFVFGTPFTLALSAVAGSSFLGSYGDGGSLLVQKVVESLAVNGGSGVTYTDESGHAYRVEGATARALGVLTASPTPEPGTWVLALLGVGLLIVAKIRVARPKGK